MTDQERKDRIFMKRAMSLAARGAGRVAPNPLVGAVIVKDGSIIAEGYHEFFGGPHAEVNAISNANGQATGATLYVTLEPCSHQGKTPPCTPLVAEQGFKRVVIGLEDPNPLVGGKGIGFLQSKGIEVTTGVMANELKEQNEVFLKYITTGKPFVILKSAMTLDGKIATITNASRWITGERSRQDVHKMRHAVSAVMVGINTVIYDDPLLNTRLRAKNRRDPLKIIVDSKLRIPLAANVLKNEPQLALLASTGQASHEKIKDIERLGAQVVICPSKEDKVDLRWLFDALGAMGTDSILIEGGSTLAFSAVQERLVDKVVFFIAPKLLGGSTAPSPLGGSGIEKMEDAIGIREWKVTRTGNDLRIEGRISKDQ